ncbi:MAG TPA: DUF4112 domain-containing protein [Gemmatimonadales bacterium]|nr:DUF4112 domain-containing protein [Gemmatimonadales bacterium]
MSDPAVTRRAEATVGTFMPRELDRLRTLSRLLDSAFVIPGTRYRIGLDGIIGLVPGIGDAIGAIFSIYIIFQAARLGVPKFTLARMIGNVGVDTIVGEIPLLGDLFDIGFKSNIRNLSLIEQHVQRPAAARAQSRRVLLVLGIGLLALLVGIVALSVVVAQLVLDSIR